MKKYPTITDRFPLSHRLRVAWWRLVYDLYAWTFWPPTDHPRP